MGINGGSGYTKGYRIEWVSVDEKDGLCGEIAVNGISQSTHSDDLGSEHGVQRNCGQVQRRVMRPFEGGVSQQCVPFQTSSRGAF